MKIRKYTNNVKLFDESRRLYHIFAKAMKRSYWEAMDPEEWQAEIDDIQSRLRAIEDKLDFPF